MVTSSQLSNVSRYMKAVYPLVSIDPCQDTGKDESKVSMNGHFRSTRVGKRLDAQPYVTSS